MNTVKTLFVTLGMGSLIVLSTPALADDDQWHYEQNRSQYISYDTAAEIAGKTVGNGRVTDVEFDNDWSGANFEVEMLDDNGREYDVIIDAKSGKVLSSRRDY